MTSAALWEEKASFIFENLHLQTSLLGDIKQIDPEQGC